MSATPSLVRVRMAANLHYDQCEAVLRDEDSTAADYQSLLQTAYKFALLRLNKRVRDGAVVMERNDPHLLLTGTGNDTCVEIAEEPSTPMSFLLVSELMIAASAAIAEYAAERQIPLLYRTQDITIPKECAGVWKTPVEIANVLHALMPSIIETKPARHAALGVPMYAPLTSPLRRYVDLVNMAQIISYLAQGEPHFGLDELEKLRLRFLPTLDCVSQVQKVRPRYWKLLYFQQQGDQRFWEAVVTEENEYFVTCYLPREGISLRGKRNLFDDRCAAGQRYVLRIGKVQPLRNEIQILEAISKDEHSGEQF